MERVVSRFFVLGLFLILAICASPAGAGTLDPPAGPDDAASAMHTLDGVYNMLDNGQAETKRGGAFTEPSASPGATGRTLDEVYGKAERLAYHVSHYVTVNTTADAVENGARLLAAYAEAKTMTPAVDKRIGVLIGPGEYDLETNELIMDTEYVDIIGLSINRDDQHIYGTSNGPGTGVIKQTAANVRIANLKVECTRASGGYSGSYDNPAAYYPDAGIGDESPAATVIMNCKFMGNANCWPTRAQSVYKGQYENCDGGIGLFGISSEVAGTFTNCDGGDWSFGRFGEASGTFTNCTAGENSFGGAHIASGIFTNCHATGIYSFGQYATGTFKGCTAGNNSFGDGGTGAGAIFENCTAGDNSFGGSGHEAAGTFTNCTAGSGSFGEAGATGTFTNCTAGSSSFGGNGNATGTFTNCRAGVASFGGGGGGTASGNFTNCTGGDYSFGGFGGGTVSGIFTNCTGGDNSFGGNGGNASGTFTNCRGGVDSFGGNGGTSRDGAFTCSYGGTGAFGVNYAGGSGSFDNCRVDFEPFVGNTEPPSVCPWP